jgi:RHS repeat-associated protein
VAGLVEKVTKGATTEYRHLISGTPGTVALYTRRSSGTNDTYYLHRDHLGSGELITNAAGTQLVKLSFGAYGERRDTDWDGPISSGDLTTLGNTTRHGFTDHEHLDSVGLIHMGGRVYDPVIGRFLSRDPYIDGVGSSQGANGYAYVWNNPLTRWDPTGYGGQADGLDVRSACNPDCPDTWSYGTGARLSNAFVSCFGNCDASAGYDNTGFWVDGKQTGVVSFLPDGRVEQVIVSATQSVWVPFGEFGGRVGGYGGMDSAAFAHGLLDVAAASEIPVASQLAGLASGAWSAWEGDWTGAGLSLAGLVPGMVWADAAKGAKGLTHWGNPKTLADHFARHGKGVGAKSADDYARQASDFFRRSQADRLPTKIDADGLIRVYDPRSNMFGAFNPDGTTRTFFQPTSPTYFDRQPGGLPWGP